MSFVGFIQKGFNQHLLMVCTLICLFSPSIAITATSQNKIEINNVIQRLNYGTIFKSEGNMHLSREYWTHTFQIPIPSDIDVPQSLSVNKKSCSKLDCQFQQSLLDQIHGVQLELYSHVSKTLKFIKTVIPYHKVNKSKRQRRSLLPFIGSLSKGLFGTATMDDVNILASHINSLTKTTENIAHALKLHGSHMSSYMATANKRMDNLQSGISNNFKAISSISRTFFLDLQHLKMVLANTSKILTKQIDLSSKLRADIDNLHASVLALVQGKLTPTFLPKSVLHKTITEIQRILSSKQPNFYISQTQIPWYYQHANFFYARYKHSLYIIVKFPITSHREPMQLYKVISYPVPINSTAAHATNIIQLPTYFAVTSHQQYYTTFTTAELATCQHDSNSDFHCTFNKALTPVTSPSCIIGLFANNKKWIKDFCTFRYFQDILKPDIVELSSTSVLLFNSWNIELICPHKQELLPGCKFCILNVPCKCTLTTKDLYYSPKLIDCHKTLNLNISIAHPVNLALLHEFFYDSTLKAILGDTTFADPVAVNLPNFQIYTHNYNQFLANDNKAHLNLSKMVQAAKNDEVVFQTLTEPLLEGNIEIASSWPSVSDIIDFVALGISILAILGFIFTFLKVRKLLAVIAILKSTAPVKSDPQAPSFIFKSLSTPTPAPSEFELLMQNFSWNHASVLINAIAILILLFCFLYKFHLQRKNKFTQIIIELTTGNECIFIPILNLPLCPSFWKIVPPSDIFHIDVSTAPFASYIKFDWTDFTVTNISGTRTINVKTKVSMSYFSALQAKRITEKPYDVHILIKHHDVYKALPHYSTYVIETLNCKEHLP